MAVVIFSIRKIMFVATEDESDFRVINMKWEIYQDSVRHRDYYSFTSGVIESEIGK